MSATPENEATVTVNHLGIPVSLLINGEEWIDRINDGFTITTGWNQLTALELSIPVNLTIVKDQSA